jgi:putative colanic acid biosynthesis UDP-glucose lipid carrier transferase
MNISDKPIEVPVKPENAIPMSRMKRAVDVILSIFVLALSSPLLILIAVGVKLSSPGPVLHLQRRCGLHGKEIVTSKFRTVTEAHGQRRVTRLGAFLRRTSLDELPQLFNVLEGTMSIVIGPRSSLRSAFEALVGRNAY